MFILLSFFHEMRTRANFATSNENGGLFLYEHWIHSPYGQEHFILPLRRNNSLRLWFVIHNLSARTKNWCKRIAPRKCIILTRRTVFCTNKIGFCPSISYAKSLNHRV